MCVSSPGGGPVTGMGDFSSGPCVGVCYYIKKRGIQLDTRMRARMKQRRPCIGLCHIKKMRERRRIRGPDPRGFMQRKMEEQERKRKMEEQDRKSSLS